MKFANLLLVVVLSAATAFAVGKYGGATTPSSQTELKETVYDRVMRTQTIRCNYILYPQFIERDPNTKKLSGLYVEFMEELGRRLSLKIDWAVETGIVDAFEGLKAGRIDVACVPFSMTPARSRVTDFTTPVLFYPTYAYVRVGDTRFDNNIKAVNDPSVTMAVLEGEMSQVIASEDFPKTKILTLQNLMDVSQVMESVATGKADIMLTEPSTIEDYLTHNPGKLKRVNAPPLRMFAGGLSVNVGEEKLKNMLNTTIESMRDTGYFERLLIKSEKDKDFYYLPAKPWRRAGD
ncbi:MAG: substrate-binding periplasmic protein [Bdellovibrionales bacterium]